MNVKKDAQRLLAKAKKNGYVVVGGKSGLERDLRVASCLEPLEAA